MESEHLMEVGHKKGRQRKKQLYNSILKQMEFYFSDANLCKDRFLGQLLQENEYVELETFLKFNKILKLTTSTQHIAKALKSSELLELNEEDTKVKRKAEIRIKTNAEECTVYIEHIQSDTTHDWLETLFNEFGKVVYVSIPKYQHNKLNKGFAFVEFETEDEAMNAVNYFESIGARISSQIEPNELCSILTFEGNQNKSNGDVKEEMKIDENKIGLLEESKKRKGYSDDDEHIDKKIKVGEVAEIKDENTDDKTEVKDDVEIESESKKKKKKSNRRKAQIRELGLQLLPKKEWKKMRNRYLEMQRSKMKMLKQHLFKKRFGNRFEDKTSNNKTDDNKSTKQEISENNSKNDDDKDQLNYTSGVIVKMHLPEPCTDAKKIKNEIKTICPDVQYIEIPTTLSSDEAYVRFLCGESAKTFCEANSGECVILEGDEEKSYWEKIESRRNSKLSKETKKQRGRDKLLKKAEKALGKHIRFDD